MLFNSIDFAIFLPVVFLLYWLARKSIKTQNLLIVISSYVFYGWWDWRFLSLLLLSSVIDFVVGLSLQSTEKTSQRKVLLGISLFANLGMLMFFKYFNFFIDNFTRAFSLLGYSFEINSLNIVLPVGISFYTFQTLSYTIDVYKRKIPASKSLIDFCAFVSFFPQLVAGPIERASHLLPQFSVKRTFSYENASLGMQQILWGFFKKIVVADNCAEIANHIFDSYQNQNGIVLIIGALAFAFQIYGDFSGYSDIAVGTARLFGFSLMQNFRYPYFSRDIGEFWRRWHISLTTWFRDYVYIPLGGSRVSKLKIARNTFIVFLVSGFWHGANWTFIGWGLFHVILFLPLILFNINRINTNSVAENRIFPNLRELFQILFTFLMVVIGWIFFRSENISSAFEYLQIIFTPDKQYFDWKSIRYGKDVLSNFSMVFSIISVIILLLTEWFHRNKSFGLEIKKSGFNWLIYIGLLLLIFIAKGGNSAFIYFQF